MPKETFFNLDEDKRNIIIKAAKDEFTEHQLHKARISNIIREANIPRGSFYQYFEDLDDLYYYVIDEFFVELLEQGKKYVEETNDIFEFAEITFSYDYDGFVNDKRHRFMMNVLKSIAGNEEYVNIHNKRRKEYILNILEHMDLSAIRFTEEDDLIKMYQMIQDMKRSVIQKTLIDRLSKDAAITEFKWYIDVLKHGLVKEK